MKVRSALLPDADPVFRLIEAHVPDGTLLPRSRLDICENIRDFVVADHEGRVVGCGALHLYGSHLAEVRSLAVLPEVRGLGAGRLVVLALLREAERQSVASVCLFTRIPDFFAALGFKLTRRTLPDKIYKDCLLCPRRHACDEVTMIRHLSRPVSAFRPPVRRASPAGEPS